LTRASVVHTQPAASVSAHEPREAARRSGGWKDGLGRKEKEYEDLSTRSGRSGNALGRTSRIAKTAVDSTGGTLEEGGRKGVVSRKERRV